MFVSYAVIWTTGKTEIMKKHFSLEFGFSVQPLCLCG